ncbi:hypothetical protein [Kineococcus sp. SYSU DK002]
MGDTTNGEKWRAAGGDALPVVLLLSLVAAVGRLVRKRARAA